MLYDKIHQVMQQFGHYELSLVIKLLSVYSTALYGSNLWQVNSDEYSKLTRSWNAAVRIIWNLPYPTHKRFLEYLSPVPHLESVLTGRYVGFLANLLNSEKPELGIIFSSCYSNLATNTGQNISFLLHKHNKKNLKELINDKYFKDSNC